MKTQIYKLCIVLILLISSCNTQKLFQFGGDQLTEPSSFKIYRHVLQPDDKISVSIWNHDDLSIGSVYGVYNSNEVYGKWVMIDPKGFAKLPVIGDIMLGDLTLDGAKDTLANIYGKFIKDPVIEIKVLNLQVTILGEVRAPGNYVLEKTENNLIEVLGRAGGLDFYADKENVKIIRGNISSGNVTQFYVDLTNMDEITSGKLNLHPNDVIFIPTLKGKTLDKKAPTLVPFASAASAIAVVAALLLKN
jgi:polysaccharide export outer membrane protein